MNLGLTNVATIAATAGSYYLTLYFLLFLDTTHLPIPKVEVPLTVRVVLLPDLIRRIKEMRKVEDTDILTPIQSKNPYLRAILRAILKKGLLFNFNLQFEKQKKIRRKERLIR